MAHTHKYETVERYPVSSGAGELGIENAEKRKCASCGYESIFLQGHGGKWITLSEETNEDARDILLA